MSLKNKKEAALICGLFFVYTMPLKRQIAHRLCIWGKDIGKWIVGSTIFIILLAF